MNNYLVRTSLKLGSGTDSIYIVKADSIKEAIVKRIEQMKLENENGTNVLFDVTLMEVIE